MSNLIIPVMITTPTVITGMLAGHFSNKFSCTANREQVCNTEAYIVIGAITGLAVGILFSCMYSACCGGSREKRTFKASSDTSSTADTGGFSGADHFKTK